MTEKFISLIIFLLFTALILAIVQCVYVIYVIEFQLCFGVKSILNYNKLLLR